MRSFHHMKEIKTVIIRGNRTENNVTFRLIQRTILPMTEKSTIETRKGQKEVWTARNGLVNIKEF